MQQAIEYYQSEAFWHKNEVEVMTSPSDQQVTLPNEISAELNQHVLFQTSGSSGGAKLVALSKQALLSSAEKVCEHFEVWAGDVWGLCLPIYHVGGFGILARAFTSGCGVSRFSEKWNAKKAVEQMDKDGVTLLSLVPTQLVDIVNANLECPSSIRAVVIGGGKLEDEVKQSAEALGWSIYPSYGMTETASQVATGDAGGGWIDTIAGWEFAVGAGGCLKVKGDGLFSSYLEEREGEWQMVPALENGWFQTKDIVEIADGKIRFVRRADRMMKILGELVDVSALENELAEQLEREVIVVDVPDQRRGVKLVPVLETELNDDAVELLSQYAGLRALEPYQVLESGFPRTPLGKIDRKAVRERVF